MTSYTSIINYQKTNTLKPNPELDLVFKKIEQVLIEVSKASETEPQKNWRAEKPAFLKKTNVNKDEILTNDINVFLNKMSITNFESISNSIIDILTKNNEKKFFEFTLDNIFRKAITQCTYCAIYTSFIKKLLENNFDVKDIILNKCNKFKYVLKEELETNRSYSKQVTKDNYAQFCKDLKDKTFKKGYSQFIGELYNNSLVSKDIVYENIEICLENIHMFLKEDPKSANVEDNCICAIEIVNTVKDNEIKEDYKEKMIAVQKSAGLPKRLMFMFIDLYHRKNK